MGPNFYQMIICQLLWVPWDRVVRWLETRYEGGRTYSVAFDGACGFCRRTIVVLRSLDLLNRVEFLDAVHQWPRIEEKFPHLDRDRCLIEMHACTPRGQTATGFYAYRMLAWALPVGWLALPFLYLPGVGWAGSAIYTAVASRRHRGICEVPLATPVSESQLPHTPKAPNTH
jgi:predicted DCC family thiol-disulfide oxidoreductase YuxK